MRILLGALALLMAGACAQEKGMAPADEFMDRLRAHCGNAYEGKLVSTDEVDVDFAQEKLVMHVRECSDHELRIPFHVSNDRSRTWVVTRHETDTLRTVPWRRTVNGEVETGAKIITPGIFLRLKHDHRHEDGSEDAVTQYGGDTADEGTASRQEFPVDQYSIDMFNREGLTVSVTNIWAMEATDDIFAYELRRENRFFRVEFDLNAPVEPPPPPWGAE